MNIPRIRAVARAGVLLGLFVGWLAIGVPAVHAEDVAPPAALSVASPTKANLAPATVVLAAPALVSKNAKAHEAAFAGYLHADNCRVALVGGNGDNDVQAWINAHSPYGINGYSPSGPGTRYGNNALTYYYDLYRNGVWWGNNVGYCMGDDANITDKFGDPPAGW